MSQLSDLHYALVQRLCDADPQLWPESVLEDVLREIDWSPIVHNDAICLVLARSLFGGSIAELASGCWVNLVPNGEGVHMRDLCDAQARSGGRGWMNAPRFEPHAFLARDTTGMLTARAAALERELTEHIEHRLAE